MTTAQVTIEKKILKWPAATRIALAEKLVASVEAFASAEIEDSWNVQIKARVEEIREGKAVGISADEVRAEARKRIDEAHRVSPAGRRRTH